MIPKKSQGLSINVIVVAALALVFLIVMAAIFYNKSGAYTKTINDCTSKGGKCVKEEECGLGRIYICPDEGDVCCISGCETQGGKCKSSCDSKTEKKIYLAQCPDNQDCCEKISNEG